MTQEEKFNKDLWDVLKRIKEKLLYAKKGEPISLSRSLLPVYGDKVLEKLEEKWKVIKIRENPWKPPSSTKEVFYLDVIHSRFNRLYRRKELEEKAKARAKEIRRLFEEEKRIEEIAKRVIEKSQKEPITQRGEIPKMRQYTFVKKNKGYFKFYKEGENIEIGNKNTRHFRLLQCLCEPHFGVQKTIEAIFEAIRLPKDKNDNDLLSYSPQRKTKILTLIEYAKKELQKNKKLQGRIKYKLDDRKNNMWLELEE